MEVRIMVATEALTIGNNGQKKGGCSNQKEPYNEMSLYPGTPTL